jgi:hypothetical protein
MLPFEVSPDGGLWYGHMKLAFLTKPAKWAPGRYQQPIVFVTFALLPHDKTSTQWLHIFCSVASRTDITRPQ